jgi:hypothetical protein
MWSTEKFLWQHKWPLHYHISHLPYEMATWIYYTNKKPQYINITPTTKPQDINFNGTAYTCITIINFSCKTYIAMLFKYWGLFFSSWHFVTVLMQIIASLLGMLGWLHLLSSEGYHSEIICWIERRWYCRRVICCFRYSSNFKLRRRHF